MYIRLHLSKTEFCHNENAIEEINDTRTNSSNISPKSREEISAAIKRLKNRKTLGSDSITTEAQKTLHMILNKYAERKKRHWKLSKMMVIPVHKNGYSLDSVIIV